MLDFDHFLDHGLVYAKFQRVFVMLNENLTLIYIFGRISLNNSPIWKIQKLRYSGEQALHPE